jgi:predicted nucleic acid-binding protein
MRILLDSNILARAAGPVLGLARELVQRLTHHDHELLLSPFLVAELVRALRYERVRRIHGFSEDEIDQFVTDLVLVAVMVVPRDSNSIEGLADPDDVLVVQAAIEGQVEVLCTLDRHLHQGKVVEYCRSRGVEILTDVELITRLRSIA